MADMLTGWDLASAEMACRERVWVCRRPKGRAWERHCQLPGFSEMYGLGARRTRLWRQQAEGRTREVLQIESNAERAENGEMRRHCAARHAFLLPVPGAESFAGSNCCQNQSRQIPFGEVESWPTWGPAVTGAESSLLSRRGPGIGANRGRPLLFRCRLSGSCPMLPYAKGDCPDSDRSLHFRSKRKRKRVNATENSLDS